MHYVQICIVLVKLFCAVDASQAGRGTLDIAVVSKGESVPVSARAMQGPEFLEVVYTPIYVATHLINVRFNGEPVPGQLFICMHLNIYVAPIGNHTKLH